nr:HEPN domain-containing protein [Gordonia sp. LAM0048]
MTRPTEFQVESLYADYQNLIDDLGKLNPRSPSGELAVARTYHKAILIAAASNLEARVKWIVVDIFSQEGRSELAIFIDKAVMSRGYHALFDWPSLKASRFFSFFGPECKERYRSLIATDTEFRSEHDSFMQLGHRRNELVHQDYAEFNLTETPDELIGLYRVAVNFPERFYEILFDDSERVDAAQNA